MAFHLGVMNNEVIKNIMNRRSHRVYKDVQIPRDILDVIVNCGLWSPSARNKQAWHFTVIQDRALIDEINADAVAAFPEENRAKWGDDYHMFFRAPTVIVISGIKDDRYSLIDCSIAMQTMCLAAESFDIGSCMIGMVKPLFDSEAGAKYIARFDLPEGYHPQFACCFGYKGGKMKTPERIEGKVNYIV
jgi:nitroreductase